METQLQFAIHRSEPEQPDEPDLNTRASSGQDYSVPSYSMEKDTTEEDGTVYMKNPVSSDQPAEAEEEENSYDGVDFNEAMATMQNAVALTRDTSGAAGSAAMNLLRLLAPTLLKLLAKWQHGMDLRMKLLPVSRRRIPSLPSRR